MYAYWIRMQNNIRILPKWISMRIKMKLSNVRWEREREKEGMATKKQHWREFRIYSLNKLKWWWWMFRLIKVAPVPDMHDFKSKRLAVIFYMDEPSGFPFGTP